MFENPWSGVFAATLCPFKEDYTIDEAGLRAYVRANRHDDFVNNVSRKLLSYALGRSLMLSDDIAVDTMGAKLAKDGYRFDSLIETIVTSSQFRNKRSGEETR